LPFVVGRLELGPDAGETRAREERYAWLEAARVGNEARYIVTAHHADDQAETVLMRVLEGSGPAGLAAMAPVSGALVRPLLPFRRAQLAAYLEERGLTGWIDPANSDPRHLRSWTRTQLLPLVRSRLPDVDHRLLRLARHAREDRAAWDAVLDLLPGLDLQVEAEGISVAAPALAGYDSELAQAVLLAAARRVGCRLVPSRIGRVLDLLEGGASGSRVPLGGRWMAELAFGRLRIAPLDEATGLHPWTLEGQSGEGVWGRWRFRWEPATAPARQGRAGLSAWFTPDPLVVRAWSAGEKLRPLGGAGHRLVVRCFQELRVPRGWRSSWPVLAENDEVLWIPGVCRSDAPATNSTVSRKISTPCWSASRR
jgi:tRNA(Ile)-lysidine synthase